MRRVLALKRPQTAKSIHDESGKCRAKAMKRHLSLKGKKEVIFIF